jgi:ATP/ADP translocase
MIEKFKKLFNFKLSTAGILFAVFAVVLWILRHCHKKKGACSKEFEIFLKILDGVIAIIMVVRIIGYIIELIRKR